jgi:SAM-dependent methyltransferase
MRDTGLGDLPVDQGGSRPRRPENYNLAYAGKPPWDIGRPQSAFLALAQAGALRGRVLDVGCGTGEHVLMAAGLGLDAAGVDFAAAAIEAARTKAGERGLAARFQVWDALHLEPLNEQFDTVLDCGLFHGFVDDERPRFVESLRTVMRPGGRYFMLCYSERQPGVSGPRRVTQDEIRSCFAEGWRIDSIEPVTIDINTDPNGALAWLASMTLG